MEWVPETGESVCMERECGMCMHTCVQSCMFGEWMYMCRGVSVCKMGVGNVCEMGGVPLHMGVEGAQGTHIQNGCEECVEHT